MNPYELLDKCSQILDNLTIVKGYIQAKEYDKKVNYRIAILLAITEMEALVCNMIDDINQTTEQK